MLKQTSLLLSLSLLCTLLLPACATEKPVYTSKPAPLDLSGNWEMNYGRSDHVEEKLRSLAKEYQRMQERQQRTGNMNRRSGPTVEISGGRSFNSVVATARLADMITRSQVVEIIQANDHIKIGRDENFTLICHFSTPRQELEADSLGTEYCYWDGVDLLYRIRLPDGLAVNHRLTLAPEGDQLRIATSVFAPNVSPFTLNRFYYRFEPSAEDFNCEFTLSKGNVCSRREQ
ncbi:MAG: hypothetical protein ACI9GW_001284 [Halieaceae bacterium]|jgi:hypothetical protein